MKSVKSVAKKIKVLKCGIKFQPLLRSKAVKFNFQIYNLRLLLF